MDKLEKKITKSTYYRGTIRGTSDATQKSEKKICKKFSPWTFGFNRAATMDIPEIIPPPETGTRIISRSGTCRKSSKPIYEQAVKTFIANKQLETEMVKFKKLFCVGRRRIRACSPWLIDWLIDWFVGFSKIGRPREKFAVQLAFDEKLHLFEC